MIRGKVNAEDFLKNIVNVGDFTRKYECCHYLINTGESRPIPGNWNVWLEM